MPASETFAKSSLSQELTSVSLKSKGVGASADIGQGAASVRADFEVLEVISEVELSVVLMKHSCLILNLCRQVAHKVLLDTILFLLRMSSLLLSWRETIV